MVTLTAPSGAISDGDINGVDFQNGKGQTANAEKIAFFKARGFIVSDNIAATKSKPKAAPSRTKTTTSVEPPADSKADV